MVLKKIVIYRMKFYHEYCVNKGCNYCRKYFEVQDPLESYNTVTSSMLKWIGNWWCFRSWLFPASTKVVDIQKMEDGAWRHVFHNNPWKLWDEKWREYYKIIIDGDRV